MALRLSKGLRNFLNETGSLKQALANGKILLYSGTQPTTADDAVSGTLLCTYTSSAGAHTAEVQATGVVTLTSSGGSVDTFTVNSLEIMGSATSYDTSLTVTAAAVVTKINNNPKNMLFTASSNLGVITITAKPGMGTLYNAKAISVTTTTLVATVTSTTFGSGTGGGVAGVDAANGLQFGDSAAGVLSKLSTQTWSGVAVATGTAGWFRFLGSVTDAGAADSSEVYIRLDGNVATSGANLNLSSTSITSGATQTLDTWTLTEPAA